MSRVLAPSVAPVLRQWLIGLAAVAIAVVLLARTSIAGIPIPVDYYQYWSAGWLVVHGENPYDPVRLHELQQSEGMTAEVPVISWHPPWTLAVTMPFGFLSISTGLLVWILLQTVAVFVSAELLWKSFGGPANRRWVCWVLTVGFAPTLFFIGAGQITGLCLLGVAAFTAAIRSGRPGLAGAAVALTAIKPHLLALFGLALLLQAIRDRSTRIAVLAGGATLAAVTLAVIAINPPVLGEYFDAIRGKVPLPYKLSEIHHPTVGWYLRSMLAPESFAVQLIPLMIGSVVVVTAWWRSRTWDWSRTVPWLVLGSVLVSPYGTWVYDLVLLVVPVLAVGARLAVPGASVSARSVATVWFVAIAAGVYICVNMATVKTFGIWIGWVSPAVLAGAFLTWWVARTGSVRESGVAA